MLFSLWSSVVLSWFLVNKVYIWIPKERSFHLPSPFSPPISTFHSFPEGQLMLSIPHPGDLLQHGLAFYCYHHTCSWSLHRPWSFPGLMEKQLNFTRICCQEITPPPKFLLWVSGHQLPLAPLSTHWVGVFCPGFVSISLSSSSAVNVCLDKCFCEALCIASALQIKCLLLTMALRWLTSPGR